MFIYLIIKMQLFFVVLVYFLFILSDIVYVILIRFINKLFNFDINNVMREIIIDKGLLYIYISYIFKFVKENSSKGGL